MKTKIFCDIAELDLIKNLIKKLLKVLQQIQAMRKAVKDYKSYSKNFKTCSKKPVSLEVFGDSFLK